MEDRIGKVIEGLRCLSRDPKWKLCSDCPYHGKGLPPCRIAICEEAEYVIRNLSDRLLNMAEDFTDYATGGSPDELAPFCANRKLECVDGWGRCRRGTDSPCEGFRPEVRDD